MKFEIKFRGFISIKTTCRFYYKSKFLLQNFGHYFKWILNLLSTLLTCIPIRVFIALRYETITF